MDYLLLFSGFIAGLALGGTVIFLLKRPSLPSDYETTKTERSEYKGKYEEKEKLFEQLKSEHSKALAELSSWKENTASLETEKRTLNERITEHKKDLELLNEQFQIRFENLANKILKEKTDTFKLDSEKSITELLKPFKEQLGQFQKKVEEADKEQFSLKKEIERIVTVNEKMNFQTESLTKALKGDSRVQGNWGEIILEKILEDSGLVKGKNYVIQGIDLGLENDEDGRKQKPDVIVNLPNEKHIIIDSKVSLTHYEKYFAEQDETSRPQTLKLFLNSVRDHVKNLHGKRYQDNTRLSTPDFVLLFMPTEGSYSLAVQNDPELHRFAWEKRIVIVCPSTLFATLRTVESIWRIELQNQNANEIAVQGGKLYEKFTGFLEDMSRIDKHLRDAGTSYEDAINKLSTGKGNLISRAEKLKKLGAQTAKSIPVKFAVIENDEDEDNNLKLSSIK